MTRPTLPLGPRVPSSSARQRAEGEPAVKKRTFAQARAVTAYFDRTAEAYSAWYGDESWLGYAFRVRKARILELFDTPGGRVLDVGCGHGITPPELIAQTCTFWGVDASPEMLRHGRKSHGSHRSVHFALGTAERLSFSSEVFDVVICAGVIEFVDDDQLAVSEMARVLKPGGTLIIGFPNRYSPFRLWRDFVFYPATSPVRRLYYRLATRPRKPHIKQRVYTEEQVSEMLKHGGCKVEDVVYCYFNVFLSPLEHLFPRLSARVSEKLEPFGRGRLRRLGGGFMVKASKG